jgi:hypothetical protein
MAWAGPQHATMIAAAERLYYPRACSTGRHAKVRIIRLAAGHVPRHVPSGRVTEPAQGCTACQSHTVLSTTTCGKRRRGSRGVTRCQLAIHRPLTGAPEQHLATAALLLARQVWRDVLAKPRRPKRLRASVHRRRVVPEQDDRSQVDVVHDEIHPSKAWLLGQERRTGLLQLWFELRNRYVEVQMGVAWPRVHRMEWSGLWSAPQGELLCTLRPDRPFERMNIAGLTGVTDTQRVALKALGAPTASLDDAHQTSHSLRTNARAGPTLCVRLSGHMRRTSERSPGRGPGLRCY